MGEIRHGMGTGPGRVQGIVSEFDTRSIRLPAELEAMIQTIPGGWTVQVTLAEWLDPHSQKLLVYGKRRNRESGEVLAQILDFLVANHPETSPRVEQHLTNPPIILGLYLEIPDSWRIGVRDAEALP